jgi:hypothetical protein
MLAQSTVAQLLAGEIYKVLPITGFLGENSAVRMYSRGVATFLEQHLLIAQQPHVVPLLAPCSVAILSLIRGTTTRALLVPPRGSDK